MVRVLLIMFLKVEQMLGLAEKSKAENQRKGSVGKKIGCQKVIIAVRRSLKNILQVAAMAVKVEGKGNDAH